MTRTVAGLFDSHRTADLVVEHLVQEYGVPRERVRVLALDAAGGAEARSPQDSDQGASLHDLGLPEENLRAYAEGLGQPQCCSLCELDCGVEIQPSGRLWCAGAQRIATHCGLPAVAG